MVATPSTMLALGTAAPRFQLLNVLNGELVKLDASRGKKGFLVAFVCNHCPYVLHLLDSLVSHCNQWKQLGLEIYFISSNDSINYPDDSEANMKILGVERGFDFPYLYDEDQSVAKMYQAACTPDFYLFNHKNNLIYRGQYDGSRPGNEITPTGVDLENAVSSLLAGKAPMRTQKPSLGCNIKWIKGNEPNYFS